MSNVKIERINKKNIQDYKKIKNQKFNFKNIEDFILNENNYAFGVTDENDIIGFAYGYGLSRPDGKSMFYIHSVDIVPEYQSKGIGTKLMDYILEHIKKENKYYKFFVLTEIDNVKACKLYSKYAEGKEQILFSNTIRKDWYYDS